MPRVLDEIDRKLLKLLLADGRSSWSHLAGEVGLSGPSVTERVRKLERDGVIAGFEAKLNAAAIGYGLKAFISVKANTAFDPPEFFERVRQAPHIQECHLVTGEYDYLLKVLCRGSDHLYDILQELQTWPGVGHTRSSIVLRTPKDTRTVPLDLDE